MFIVKVAVTHGVLVMNNMPLLINFILLYTAFLIAIGAYIWSEPQTCKVVKENEPDYDLIMINDFNELVNLSNKHEIRLGSINGNFPLIYNK
jgi:hypothetical protein